MNQQPSSQPEYNQRLVAIATPILHGMPFYFGGDTFDRESINTVLKAFNCPEGLLDEVLEECRKAGIVRIRSDGSIFIDLATNN